MSSKTRHYQHWYLLSIRGLFLIILGVYALILPVDPKIKFIKIFEIFAIASGLLLVQNALLNRKHANWQFVLFNGVLDLSFGIMLWLVPSLSFASLKIVLAIFLRSSDLVVAANGLELH